MEIKATNLGVVFLCLLLLVGPSSARAQALLAGSEYYDSFQTLAQVVIIQSANDESGKTFLRNYGHINGPLTKSRPIIVVARGQEPDSGCEFQFPDSPALFWTFSRNVAQSPEPTPSSAAPLPPVAIATPTPAPTASPESPSPTVASPAKAHLNREVRWHLVNGQWKWQPIDPHAFKGVSEGAKAP